MARTPLYGARSGLYFGKKDVAGKTGTTDDKRDAWMIGYTTDVAVGVWTGNNDNSPMKKGSKLSIQPWHDFMEIILDEYDNGKFKDYTIPDNFLDLPAMVRGDWKGGETYIIDSVSGKLATEFTPEETKIRVTNFDPHTILHSVNKSKPQEVGNSQNDDQYENWEYGVVNYSKEHYFDKYNYDFVVPTEYDDVHGPNGLIQSDKFNFDIEGLDDEYEKGDNINISLDFEDISNNEVKEVFYYVNNSFVGSLLDKPFVFNFTTDDITYLKRDNIIRVLVESDDGEKLAKEKHFIVDIPEEINEEENIIVDSDE
jgi:membrane carboxypeptidase/penicillin-binding protein PbpC